MIRYHATWVLPITRPAIAQGTVVEHEGRIAWVGSRADAPPGDDVELGDAVLLPGLVNAHTHLELTVMRGFLEDLSFCSWIGRLTRARREVLDHDALLESARLGIAEGLLAGITTFADTSKSVAPFDAMRSMRVRGVVYKEVFGADPAQCEASLDGLRAEVEQLRRGETELVRVGVSPHAPYSVSDRLFAATAEYARSADLQVAVHIAESEEELCLVRDGEGPWADGHRNRGIPVSPRAATPLELLERTGVLDVSPLLIHCVRADAADVMRIARHDCAVAHCPASNAKLGHGIAPLTEMLAAGVRVGLGSDSVASNNRMDLLDEARVAVLMQRARLGRYDAVSAAAALELATLGGARALGLDRDVGSLDVGKAADLAAFPLDGARASPAYDPATALIFALAGASARLVTVAGRVLVRDGRLVESARSAADLRARGALLAQALAAWAGRSEAAPAAAAPTTPGPAEPASPATR